MSHIHIKRAHALTPRKARDAANRVAEELGEEFGLASTWDENVLHFKRTGVNGQLSLHGKSVEIEVRLGFVLLALKPAIEREIHKFFDENFPPVAASARKKT